MEKVSKFSGSFLLGTGLYLIIADSLALHEILVAVPVGIIVAIFSMRYLPVGVGLFNPLRIFAFLRYLPVFIKEMVIANIRIASIVLRPSLPIKPELKKGRMQVKSPEGKLMLSSSITLTPGTLTVDTEGQEILIHCVNTEESAEEIMGPFENYIKRITE